MKLRTIILFLLLLVTLLKIRESNGDRKIKFRDIYATQDDELIEAANKILKTLDQMTSSLYNEDVVVVFGSTKSDKNLLVQFLTGDNDKLISNKTDGETWEMLNFDNTPFRKPLLSNLINIDITTGKPYYEFPFFYQNKSFDWDMRSKYYTWRVINEAKSLKFIITISSSEEKNSIINVGEFVNLVKHITKFVKNIEKFNNSIAIIVTNVENPLNVPIKKSRSIIVDNLHDAYAQLNKSGDIEGSKLVTNLITLDENGRQNKIGILTRPIEGGIVSDNYWLQQDKKVLKSMIDNSIKFVIKDNNDFNYAPPVEVRTKQENKKLIDALEDLMQRRINSTRNTINQKILDYFKNHEKNFKDIHGLKNDLMLKSLKIHKIQNSVVLPWNDDGNHINIPYDRKILRRLEGWIKTFNIGIPEEHFINILHYYKYLEFTEVYRNHSDCSILENWEMDEVNKFIDDSIKWYIFLDDLKSLFSSFEFQNLRGQHDMHLKRLDEFCLDKNFEKFLTLFDDILLIFSKNNQLQVTKELKVLTDFHNLQNISINDIKIERLCKMYHTTLLDEIEMNCLDNTLQMKGEFIKFDQIPPKNFCPGGVKRLELFAFNTLILNSDLNRTGEELEIVAIAPKWMVYGDRSIILDGLPGKKHDNPKVEDSYTPGYDGEDGKPGFPGGPAGHFLGIGAEVVQVNENYDEIIPERNTVTISANGGSGGKGQDGGNGAKGANGVNGMIELKKYYGHRSIISESTPIPKELINCGPSSKVTDEVCRMYNNGSSGHPNGNGGNGGKGGLPGLAGNIHLFLSRDNIGVDFKEFNETGVAGQDGIGGLGGNGSMDGLSTYRSYKHTHKIAAGRYMSYFNSVESESEEVKLPRRVLEKGKDGESGKNTEGLKDAEHPTQTQFPQSVNKYKSLLRERMKDGLGWIEIMQFYKKLNDDDVITNNKRILNIYNTLGLVDELQGLEEQFFKLYNDLDFLPFYESLIHRVKIYSKNLKPEENNIGYTKVLAFLYTSIHGKITILKDDFPNSLIIDIRKYLNLVTQNIQEVMEATNELKKNNLIQEFKNEIDNKINEANQFAEQIEAEVHGINKNMNMGLKLMTNKTIYQETIGEKKLTSDKTKVEAASKRVIIHGVFEVLKVVATLASFCGPWGGVAGGILETGLNYAEPFVLKSMTSQAKQDYVVQNTGQLILKARSHIDTVTTLLWQSQQKAMINNIEHLKLKEKELPTLVRVREELENVFNKSDPLSDKSSIDKFQEVILEEQETINNELKEEDSLEMKPLNNKTEIIETSFNKTEISKTEKELDEIVKELEEAEEKKEKKKASYEQKMKVLNYLKNLEKVNRIVKSGYQVSRDIDTDEAEVTKIEKEIKSDMNNVKTLDSFQDTIRQTIMPMLRSMRKQVEDIEDSLGSKSHVALDVTKWQVQQTLSITKSELKKVSKSFPEVSEYFGNLIQKLIDTLNTLINIYDRIQNYQDRKVLMEYIAEMYSPSMREFHVDSNLNEAMSYLKVILDTNMILDPYQRTMNSFKQYTFPFAQFYMSEFSLPSNLKMNDTEGLRSNVIYQMQRFAQNIDKNSLSVLPNMDEYIHKGEFSTENEYLGPFYVWKNSEHKSEIGELLSGKKITLKADVEKGLKKNAVKFKRIEIQFRAFNPKRQKDLENDLKQFQVTMTHMGNSYYRCDRKYYVITSSNQTYSYTFQKKSDSNPMLISLSYEKLQNGDFLLSPYTLWQIQLQESSDFSFDILKKYRYQVDIILTGYGQYVDTEAKVCNSNLKKYYNEEITVFPEVDTISDYEAKEYLDNYPSGLSPQ